MGNKRKFIPYINELVNFVEAEIGEKLTIAEGFSGSGIVARLFKTRSKTLYVNDISELVQNTIDRNLSIKNDIKDALLNISNKIEK